MASTDTCPECGRLWSIMLSFRQKVTCSHHDIAELALNNIYNYCPKHDIIGKELWKANIHQYLFIILGIVSLLRFPKM